MADSKFIPGSRGRRANFLTEDGTANTVPVGGSFVTLAATGTPSGVWASTEAQDTFTGAGVTGLSGSMAITEAKDTFAATGNIPVTGTLSATDAEDTFTGAGAVPPTGTMSATEHGDTWATSGGFDTFGFESLTTSSGGSAFTVTTGGPDRVIVLAYASIGNNHQFNTVTGIDGPLTWNTESFAFGILPGGEFSDGVSLHILYAHAHDKLTNQVFNITASGGAINNTTAHVAIRGLNGNFNDPWARPNSPAPTTGFSGFKDDGTGSTPFVKPFGTGTDSMTPQPYPSVTFAFAMASTGGTSLPFGPPFTELVAKDFAGVQRDGQISLGAQYQPNSIPWQASDSSELGISWSGIHTGFLAIADTMIVTLPPNRWVSQEAADGFRANGYVGTSAGPIGQFTPTEAKDVFSAHGFQPVSGSMSARETPDTFSAFIKVPLIGTLTATEKPDKFAGTGIGLGEDGTLMVNESVDTFAATGYTPVSGTFNTSETPDKARFIGAGVVSQRKRRTFYVT